MQETELAMPCMLRELVADVNLQSKDFISSQGQNAVDGHL